MTEDAGRGWRRVVASPRPLEIVEEEAIERLLEHGIVVVAVPGGAAETASGSAESFNIVAVEA